MSTTTSGHVTRTIEAATPHLLQSLIGVHDANLKQIVKEIPVRIVSRSGKLLLTGEPADVKLASEVIEAMQTRLMNNLAVDETVISGIIETALSSRFHQPDSSSLDEYIEEVVGLKGASDLIPATSESTALIQLAEANFPEEASEKQEEKSGSESLEPLSVQEPWQEHTDDSVGNSVESKEESAASVEQQEPAKKERADQEKRAEKPAAKREPERAVIKTCTPMSIHPRSHGQAKYLQAIERNDLVFCSGPAGSGKTYLAVAMALHCLQNETVRKIVLVRPAVEAGEKLGFLPGDMLAKVNPFLRPLLDALRDMIDYDQVQKYMEHDVIEIVPLAFMRGRTLNDTFMILDEAQNTTITQMKMFLTRMGTGSKVIVTGDETQNDLPAHVTSGLTDAMRRLKGIRGATSLKLDGRDIVRHRLVRDIVQAYDNQAKPGATTSF